MVIGMIILRVDYKLDKEILVYFFVFVKEYYNRMFKGVI